MVNQDMHSATSSSVKKDLPRLARIGGDAIFWLQNQTLIKYWYAKVEKKFISILFMV